MTTSANVVEYIISKNGKQVGKHRQHCYCKTNWDVLFKFIPLEDYTIQAHGLDEEEEPWANDELNLKTFFLNMAKQGLQVLNDDGEFYFWVNKYNNKKSQSFAFDSEALLAFHHKLLVWKDS